MRRPAIAVLLGLVILLLSPATAHADEDDWAITRYEVTAVVARDGGVDVQVGFDFDFAGTPGHGPYVTLPVRQRIAGDPDHYRGFPVTGVSATSPSGAPAQVQREEENGVLGVRIGDEDVEVEGVQSYELRYHVRGLVSPGVGAGGADEIFWNVVGQQWEVPLGDVTVRITGPAAVSGSDCFVGRVGSTQSCGAAQATGGTAVFRQPSVAAGSGLTVVAAWPAGTFVGAEPLLLPRRNLGNTFTLDPVTGGLAGLLALVGVGGFLAHVRRRGRDQQYAGLTPGLSPADPAEPAATRTRSRREPVAVQFSPPAGARPGEVGTLLDEVAHPHDVTATIIDLAVRGHLRIEETGAAGEPGQPAAERSWRLVRTDRHADPAPLLAHEQLVLDRLFADGRRVELDDLGPSFAGTLGKVQTALYEAVTERGWFSANPATVRGRWYGVGAAVLAAGAVLTLVLALTVGWGLVGLAVVVVGVVVLAMAHALPARTAEGSAVLAQALGFRTYLETAEAEQLRFEEGEDLFSRYLPYAIAFGVAERWARVFADLAARGHDVPDPTWYVGTSPVAFFAAGSFFPDTLGAFSAAATTSMTTATAGSSGGSGMSGGYAGGGVGGGGGGGW